MDIARDLQIQIGTSHVISVKDARLSIWTRKGKNMSKYERILRALGSFFLSLIILVIPILMVCAFAYNWNVSLAGSLTLFTLVDFMFLWFLIDTRD